MSGAWPKIKSGRLNMDTDHGPTLRPEFLRLKARLYRAWTGLAWNWCVEVPDARWACGHEHFEAPTLATSGQTFQFALAVLRHEIADRSRAGHPWRSVEHADPNWLAE